MCLGPQRHEYGALSAGPTDSCGVSGGEVGLKIRVVSWSLDPGLPEMEMIASICVGVHPQKRETRDLSALYGHHEEKHVVSFEHPYE